MDVNIAAKLALPIGKSSYVPLSSSNGFLTYSTAMANGIHVQRVYQLKNENEKDEDESSNNFFQKVSSIFIIISMEIFSIQNSLVFFCYIWLEVHHNFF